MIGIIDYRAGNGPSVLNALQKLSIEAKLISQAEHFESVTSIILPGVGSAHATMASLTELGLVDALDDKVRKQKMPFLAICVGLQILFEYSVEGDVECLGWVKGDVKRFPNTVRVPQMGWNEVKFIGNHPLTAGIETPAYFYFVNSYYVVPDSEDIIIGTTEYGTKFCSLIAMDNIYAAQFHVEKSGVTGLKMLRNFATIAGEK